MRRRIALTVGILLVLTTTLLCGGCSLLQAGNPNPTEQATNAPVATNVPEATAVTAGQTNNGPQINLYDVVPMQGVDADLIITSVMDITESDYLEVGQKFISPWIFVKNTGSEPIYVSYSAFVLVDTDNTEYEASYYTPGVLYDGATVLPGGIIEGPVYFVVPYDATAYSLKASPDLYYETTNMVEIDLQEESAEPSGDHYTAEYVEYYSDPAIIELNTAHDYDGKLSVTVTGAEFVETADYTPNDSYAFYQVSLTVKNLTAEDLNVTLDYMYNLYSPEYSHLIEQISMPFASNEMWVETLLANESKDFVLTFEIKADSTEHYLVVQDFFESNEPALFALEY